MELSLAPNTVISHYRIVRRLGAGGMGEVYLAEDSTLSRKVAIKFLAADSAADEKAKGRLTREARAAAQLDHPNICGIHEVGEDRGLAFIVMQYVEGETLAARMRRKPLELDEALDVALQLTDALTEAHSHGIIHRDIKPQNIMLTARGQAKVMDFGLAKLVADDAQPETESMLTGAGAVLGTVPYMSPEQVRGEPLDARSDLFSFGTVLYEMIAGTQPFAARSPADTISAILTRETMPLARYSPQVPGEVERIVGKALAKNREERYQTAKDLLIDLRRLKRSQEISSESNRSAVTAAIAKPSRAALLRRSMIGALGMIVLTGAVVGYLKTRHASQTEQPAAQHALSRLTFDAGLQSEPTWSPDGRFIAYSSDRAGNFAIFVQPVGEGNSVQVTHSTSHDWQPDWSPDGKRIVFRSERDGGGLYVVPALGGSERKISSFGYHPRWSPDGTRILFDTQVLSLANLPTLYLMSLDGDAPHEILSDFFKDFVTLRGGYAAWHPDGQRISIWATHRQLGPGLWTLPPGGGRAVKSGIRPEVSQRLKEAGVIPGRFAWSPSGEAFYFEGRSRGVTNLWKIVVNPKTLEWIGGPERLTTGAGDDADLTISPNGKNLAFSTRTEATRIWSLPFDAATGKIKGDGKPETPAGVMAWSCDLSVDGSKLVYIATRPGKQEVRVKLLDNGEDRVLIPSDDYTRTYPAWSRDAKYLVFRRIRPPAPDAAPGTRGLSSITVLSAGGGDERAVITPTRSLDGPKDWFADGQRLLAVTWQGDARAKISMVPLAAAPNAETKYRVLAEDPDHNFFQPKLSPDERWIAFMRLKIAEPGVANIYVMPVSGGEQTRITEGQYMDDKLRWSPDGRTIYFLSQRGGFFNVWGIHFNPAAGKPVGQVFRVTDFQSPARMATPANQASEMGVSAKRLVLPITEVSGSIWVLENVER